MQCCFWLDKAQKKDHYRAKNLILSVFFVKTINCCICWINKSMNIYQNGLFISIFIGFLWGITKTSQRKIFFQIITYYSDKANSKIFIFVYRSVYLLQPVFWVLTLFLRCFMKKLKHPSLSTIDEWNDFAFYNSLIDFPRFMKSPVSLR